MRQGAQGGAGRAPSDKGALLAGRGGRPPEARALLAGRGGRPLEARALVAGRGGRPTAPCSHALKIHVKLNNYF